MQYRNNSKLAISIVICTYNRAELLATTKHGYGYGCLPFDALLHVARTYVRTFPKQDVDQPRAVSRGGCNG